MNSPNYFVILKPVCGQLTSIFFCITDFFSELKWPYWGTGREGQALVDKTNRIFLIVGKPQVKYFNVFIQVEQLVNLHISAVQENEMKPGNQAVLFQCNQDSVFIFFFKFGNNPLDNKPQPFKLYLIFISAVKFIHRKHYFNI